MKFKSKTTNAEPLFQKEVEEAVNSSHTLTEAFGNAVEVVTKWQNGGFVFQTILDHSEKTITFKEVNMEWSLVLILKENELMFGDYEN